MSKEITIKQKRIEILAKAITLKLNEYVDSGINNAINSRITVFCDFIKSAEYESCTHEEKLDLLNFYLAPLFEQIEKSTKANLSNGKQQAEKHMARAEQAAKKTTVDKIRYILECADLLGNDVADYYDRLHDISANNTEFLDHIYAFIQDMFSDEHYKSCDCVSKRFDLLMSCDSLNELDQKM